MMACVADKGILAAPCHRRFHQVIAQLPNFKQTLKKHDITEFEMHTAGQYKRTITMSPARTTIWGGRSFTRRGQDHPRALQGFSGQSYETRPRHRQRSPPRGALAGESGQAARPGGVRSAPAMTTCLAQASHHKVVGISYRKPKV